MSFVDLATLTMHRRTELEGRINTLDEKCDHAINNIKKLKLQAHNFVPQLNCEPVELKDRFLKFMKKLDEYMYLITDFNLSIGQLEELTAEQPPVQTPVQDSASSVQCLAPTYTFKAQPLFNLMDALSEPTPSTSCECPNLCPPNKPKRLKVPKEDQVLIAFSSTSCSSESVPSRRSEMVNTEVQCTLSDRVQNIKLDAPEPVLEPCNLPAQSILEEQHVYDGTIMTIDGGFFWVITEDVEEVRTFMIEMTEYYKDSKDKLTLEQVKSISCCAYYDAETDCYYRALFVKEVQDEPNMVDLFVVDTGELRPAHIDTIKPLQPRYCNKPPYARCCYLAGLHLNNDKKEQCDTIMKDFVGVSCTIEIDDNSSEALGVYIVLESGETLNNVMVERGLAQPLERSPEESNSQTENSERCGPPEMLPEDINITDDPEYEDPVEAVTGYHNRDEADICKHYKGGPDRTCFKGLRCTKKHIMKHPDGWTLDRVEVVGKINLVPLPTPDTWLKALVTSVCHLDRVYVQFVTDKHIDEVPDFGVVLPPMNLEALFRDLNSPATRYELKPLEMAPAPGEIVAALYPVDNCWYRARVINVTRANQSIEVLYIDYGTVLWVKEDNVRQLPARFTALPAQAVCCVLAGVFPASRDSKQWAQAKQALSELALDRTVDCHVIARDFNELTVDLYDPSGYSIAEQLAAGKYVQLQPFNVVNDRHVTQKLVVP